MTEIFAMLAANGPQILAAVLAVHTAALAIANLTPTPKDNEVLARIYKVVEFFAGIITSKAKQ